MNTEDYEGNSRRIEAYWIYQKAFETDKWIKEIPEIQFPDQWKIKIIPPFGGAIVRFRVICDKANISVFLDGYQMLGCRDCPYWEIYPSADGDIDRFDMLDIPGLIKGIWASINAQSGDDQI